MLHAAPTPVASAPALHDALPIWKRALAELEVAALGVVHALGLAQLRRAGDGERAVQERLDLALDGVGKLHAVGGEELDAVVLDRKSTRLNSSHTVISYAVFSFQK